VRVGIDTYSFHRRLGFLRAGETEVPVELRNSSTDAIRAAAGYGVDVVAAQTCFLPPIDEVDVRDCVAAAGSAELVPSWGAPNGLQFGADAAAAADLARWIVGAAGAGCRLIRIVLGGPSMRGLEPDDVRTERSLPVLARLADAAILHGVRLAIENHGDTGTRHVADILRRLDHPAVGSCFDTANALRTGDDAVESAHELAQWVMMLHLKDVEPLERQISHVSGPCSVPFGTGVVDLDGVLDALAMPISSGAAVCIELGQLAPGADEDAMIRSGLSWLRDRSLSRPRPAAPRPSARRS